MSHTVYEEGHLGNFPPQGYFGETDDKMLPLPHRSAAYQGLYLDTDEDSLIGWAEMVCF